MPNIATFENPHLRLASPNEAVLPARHFGALLADWLTPSALLAHLREYVRRQRVKHELSCLTDRELSDIRLTRCEISQIFKPDFARRRAADLVGLSG